MKMGAMLSDVLRSLWRRPVTQRYPFERRAAPARLRGKLHWNPEKCTGCCLCSKECPSKAIELITLDKKSKRFVVRYHVDRCTFCAQCVQNCRFGCLAMSNEEWELAALSKAPFTVYYGDETDVQAVVAGLLSGETSSTES
jgi:formate hydrogenlyase subunit 6/NADH:ubiquinone oxidoreductase subunit I